MDRLLRWAAALFPFETAIQFSVERENREPHSRFTQIQIIVPSFRRPSESCDHSLFALPFQLDSGHNATRTTTVHVRRFLAATHTQKRESKFIWASFLSSSSWGALKQIMPARLCFEGQPERNALQDPHCRIRSCACSATFCATSSRRNQTRILARARFDARD